MECLFDKSVIIRLYGALWLCLKAICILMQLVWIKLDTQTILAIERQIVQHNPRITVHQSADRLEFTLRIRNVEAVDAGVYCCRLNTKPFMQMKAALVVQCKLLVPS